MSYIVHLQLGKDSFAGAAFITSAALVWWYTHELILACGILALAVDVCFVIHHMVKKKYTYAQLKDFMGVIIMLVYVILTLYCADATKYRLEYCLVLAFLGFIDALCVSMHLTGIFEFYTKRLSVETHNAVAKVVRLNAEYVSPY